MSKHRPAPDRTNLPALGSDDAPYDLDRRKAVRGRNVGWLRALQERQNAKKGLDVVAVHLESGETVYEAYANDLIVGRFASAQEAWEAARRSVATAASGPLMSG
jgi:hypothetical protein